MRRGNRPLIFMFVSHGISPILTWHSVNVDVKRTTIVWTNSMYDILTRKFSLAGCDSTAAQWHTSLPIWEACQKILQSFLNFGPAAFAMCWETWPVVQSCSLVGLTIPVTCCWVMSPLITYSQGKPAGNNADSTQHHECNVRCWSLRISCLYQNADACTWCFDKGVTTSWIA